MGQTLTRRPATQETADQGSNTIRLSTPPACTVSKAHPCVYYGGDFNMNDPNANGYANENTLSVPNTYTYNEVNVPVAASISASFSNNQATDDVFDPQTALWFYRTGVSEGDGGTLICSGDNPAMITQINYVYGIAQYEVLTKTPCKVPAGDVWFVVTPNCTNPNDPGCAEEFWESTTDGTLNAINGKFTVTSKTGMGPTIESVHFGYNYASWCSDIGLCGDGMSAGVLK